MAGRLIIPVLAIVAIALISTGCARTTATQGQRDIRADWSFGTLTSTLPRGYAVVDVMASAEAALIRMGYSITERHDTDDKALLEARASGSGRFEKVVIEAELEGRRTRVEVTTRPSGDEDRARAILDEMLVLLGL